MIKSPKTIIAALFIPFLIIINGTALAVPPPSANPQILNYLPELAKENDSISIDTIGLSANYPAATGTEEIFGICELFTIQVGATFGGSDCWGWQSPDESEYVIMGVNTGLVIVNANTGEIVDQVAGPSSFCGNILWRDIVTYGKYCYVVSECSGFREGLMIIDMSFLPDSVHYLGSYNPDPNTSTSHNLAIDTARGFAYIMGQSGNKVRVVNLSNPIAPSELPSVSVPNIHDMFARNDTLWVAEANSHSFSIWDMADKNSAILLARVVIPQGGYVHNIWPTGDGRHVATTEETIGKTVKFWNIENMSNITMVSEYLGPSSLAHNVQFIGDTAYIAHYEYGVRVVDWSDPQNPTEIGHFDSWLSGENSNFNGNWGVFPHTSSGKVYLSNLDGRLFILQAGTYLADTLVADSIAAAPATKVRVDISINNKYPINAVTIPIDWSGPFNLLFDSVSTFGHRTEDFVMTILGTDFANSRGAWKISALLGQAVPPGSGPVASIYFRIPATAAGEVNPIKIGLVGIIKSSITTDCFEFIAPVQDGAIYFFTPSGCCVDGTGNIDGDGGIDIADLTVLIDHLFINFPELICPDEANVDGDPAGNVDIADLTKLIDHLFISFVPVADCL